MATVPEPALTVPPTAQQLPAEEQVTRASSFSAIAPVPPGCDMSVLDQVRPIQCSAWLRNLSWLDGPKAVLAGPVLAGPVLTGPVLTGPVLARPLPARMPVLAIAPLINMTAGHAGLRVLGIPTSG